MSRGGAGSRGDARSRGAAQGSLPRRRRAMGMRVLDVDTVIYPQLMTVRAGSRPCKWCAGSEIKPEAARGYMINLGEVTPKVELPRRGKALAVRLQPLRPGSRALASLGQERGEQGLHPLRRERPDEGSLATRRPCSGAPGLSRWSRSPAATSAGRLAASPRRAGPSATRSCAASSATNPPHARSAASRDSAPWRLPMSTW